MRLVGPALSACARPRTACRCRDVAQLLASHERRGEIRRGLRRASRRADRTNHPSHRSYSHRHARRAASRAGPAPNDPTYRAALKDRLKSLPYRPGAVCGRAGRIHNRMIRTIRQRLSCSLEDRPYFQAHRDGPEPRLAYRQPLQSRSVGVWFVSFSRRISHPDGSFGGIVVAALEPRYFKCFYKGLSSEKGNLIALLLKDGTLLARTPDHEATIGKTYADIAARMTGGCEPRRCRLGRQARSTERGGSLGFRTVGRRRRSRRRRTAE